MSKILEETEEDGITVTGGRWAFTFLKRLKSLMAPQRGTMAVLGRRHSASKPAPETGSLARACYHRVLLGQEAPTGRRAEWAMLGSG